MLLLAHGWLGAMIPPQHLLRECAAAPCSTATYLLRPKAHTAQPLLLTTLHYSKSMPLLPPCCLFFFFFFFFFCWLLGCGLAGAGGIVAWMWLVMAAMGSALNCGWLSTWCNLADSLFLRSKHKVHAGEVCAAPGSLHSYGAWPRKLQQHYSEAADSTHKPRAADCMAAGDSTATQWPASTRSAHDARTRVPLYPHTVATRPLVGLQQHHQP
jgi:hypothetical protein